MEQVVFINGKKQSKLSVLNRVTMFGDGLFETCLVENRKLRFWSKHFLRLENGRVRLQINKIPESIWLKDINKAISSLKIDRCVLKIILSRGEGSRGYGFDEDITPTRIIIASSVPSNIPDQYSLTICDSGYSTNALLSGIKHCNRLEQVISRFGMKGDECIMLDSSGYVVSTSQANIFIVKDGVMTTPNLEECGIEGTRRSVVLEIVKEMGLQVEVGSVPVPELLDADEVFITNSVIGIRPVYMINDRIYNQHGTTNTIKDAFYDVQNKSKITTKNKGKRAYIKWVTLILFVLLFWWLYSVNDVSLNSQVVYQLSPGSTINLVGSELEKLDYINSSWYFVSIAKLLKLDNSMKSGYYEIKPEMSITELLDSFARAKVATRRVTLVEGLTVQEYYQQLKTIEAVSLKYGFNETMRLAGTEEPYEGKFWPDTYIVNYGDSAHNLLERANKMMRTKLNNAWSSRKKNLLLKNSDELLILASLIEKETANHAEKSKISGVFVRRLQKGMRLQTDASVVYALGDSYTGSLTKKDLSTDSPYNTYKNNGLPPSAIGSVGAESLYAAAHPDSGKSLYFVSKKDGTHAFSETYKEHQLNINKYLKNL